MVGPAETRTELMKLIDERASQRVVWRMAVGAKLGESVDAERIIHAMRQCWGAEIGALIRTAAENPQWALSLAEALDAGDEDECEEWLANVAIHYGDSCER